MSIALLIVFINSCALFERSFHFLTVLWAVYQSNETSGFRLESRPRVFIQKLVNFNYNFGLSILDWSANMHLHVFDCKIATFQCKHCSWFCLFVEHLNVFEMLLAYNFRHFFVKIKINLSDFKFFFFQILHWIDRVSRMGPDCHISGMTGSGLSPLNGMTSK